MNEQEQQNLDRHLKKSHSLMGKNCQLHPKGSSGCERCHANKYIRVTLGETLRLIKNPVDKEL